MPIFDYKTGRGPAKVGELRSKENAAAIAETTFTTVAGMPPSVVDLNVRCIYYLTCSQAGAGGGTAKLRYRWTDSSGVAQQTDSANINLNSLGSATSGVVVTEVPHNGSITYEIIVTGGVTNYKYDLFMHAEEL